MASRIPYTHDQIVQGLCHVQGKLGLLLQGLLSRVVVHGLFRDEVVDHGYRRMVTYAGKDINW